MHTLEIPNGISFIWLTLCFPVLVHTGLIKRQFKLSVWSSICCWESLFFLSMNLTTLGSSREHNHELASLPLSIPPSLPASLPSLLPSLFLFLFFLERGFPSIAQAKVKVIPACCLSFPNAGTIDTKHHACLHNCVLWTACFTQHIIFWFPPGGSLCQNSFF